MVFQFTRKENSLFKTSEIIFVSLVSRAGTQVRKFRESEDQ